MKTETMHIFLAGMIAGSMFVSLPLVTGLLPWVSESECVRHGAAEYQVNPQTGEVRFAWKESK